MRPGKASHAKYRPVKKIDSSPLMLVMNCSASGGGGGGGWVAGHQADGTSS